MQGNNTAAGGIGFFGALTLLFIALRLLNVIDWPWVWVLAPLWAPALAIGIFMLLIFLVGLLLFVVNSID